MIELAGCVIRDSEGKLLLLHRNTEKVTQWELPGGKIEAGEEPAATAAREIGEELGVDVEILRKLGEASFRMSESEWHYHWFEAQILEGKPNIREPHLFDELRYLPPDTLRERDDVSPNIHNLLNDHNINL